MKLHEMLTELVIIVRESADAERSDVRVLLRTAEREIDRLQDVALRRKSRRRNPLCVRCEVRRTDSLLCPACWADAPHAIGAGFRNSTGLAGLRSAHEQLLRWARGMDRERKEAA